MRCVKLTLAYDGTNYSGWQTQPDRVTVQETLERALRRVVHEEIRVVASGRTDAGVHALGQVVSLRTASELPAATLQRALNSELPDDVAVLAAEDAPQGFHAIASARRKRYRYWLDDSPVRDVFNRAYAWHLYVPLDAAAMHCAAQGLVGRHDFASFQTAGSERNSTVRTVFELNVARVGHAAPFGALQRVEPVPDDAADAVDRGLICLEIEADGFLYNMVRTIVGTLVEVGLHKQDEDWPARVMAATDRQQAGRTAPPQGLFLVRVEY